MGAARAGPRAPRAPRRCARGVPSQDVWAEWLVHAIGDVP
jgi:hypothetical protein